MAADLTSRSDPHVRRCTAQCQRSLISSPRSYALLAFVYTLLVLRRQSKRHNGVGFWIWQIKTRGDDKFFVTKWVNSHRRMTAR